MLAFRANRITPHIALLPMALTVLVAYIGAALWTFKTSLTASRTFASDNFIGAAQYVRACSTTSAGCFR